MKIGVRTYNSRKVVFSRHEIEKDLINKEDLPLLGYYLEMLEYAKILSLNTKFQSELKRLRSKYNFDKATIKELDDLYKNIYDNKEAGKIWSEIENRVEQAKIEISKIIKLDRILFKVIEDVILFGFFDPDEYAFISSISYSFDEENAVYEIFIHRNLSKNLFLKFIDKSWDDINNSLKKLPKYRIKAISDRDYRIVELRDYKKLKYKEIADKIIEEYKLDNKDGYINEDSIKTAYKRAKQIINSFNF